MVVSKQISLPQNGEDWGVTATKHEDCMSYELAFTRGFKDGLEKLPYEIYPIIDRQLTWISADPFAKNPNATRMKNVPRTFRVKIGSHVRMLYRVQAMQKRAEFFGIGSREHIYDREVGKPTPLTPIETQRILEEIKGAASNQSFAPHIAAQTPTPTPQVDLPVAVEELPWISSDELFLLHVPQALWAGVLAAGSMERLQSGTLDAGTRAIIEDYWTNPNPTQVEKLYSLGSGQSATNIAKQSLSAFLLVLDPEQKGALQKLKDDGPYLLKGSAGTGKSLVGLYHIRDMIIKRAGVSLFDSQSATYGVITYTNTLVDANFALLRSITPASEHAGIRCSTLDKMAYGLVEQALGARPNALNTEGISNWINEHIGLELDAKSAEVLERLGSDYVADEIEQVIVGNGLESSRDYVDTERRGRKRGLREFERLAVWDIYERFLRLAEKRHVQTFEQWRAIALKFLRANPNHSKFSSLFVDEAQDFSKVARQLCLELVGDPKNLLLAADTGQSIYALPVSWRQSDPRFDFRRRKPILLARSYRATWQIGAAIAPLRTDPGDEEDSSSNASPVFSGPKPSWIDAPRLRHAELVCAEVQTLLANKENPINAGQIAIIVRDAPSMARYERALSQRGIASELVVKGSPLQINGTRVHIVTAHSSKGLGFPVVFVPELHADVYPWRMLVDKAKDEQQREQIEEAEQRLIYVALSRASHQLCIVVDPDFPSPFVRKLDRKAHWS